MCGSQYLVLSQTCLHARLHSGVLGHGVYTTTHPVQEFPLSSIFQACSGLY